MQAIDAIELLRSGPEGVEKWNAWRSQQPGELPNLEKARLGGADLRGANLTQLRLFRADLSRADLQGADLSETNCSEANFASANCRELIARGAKLFRIDFTGADLSNAMLTGSYLGESLLMQLNLSGADLTNVRGLRFTQLEPAKIDDQTILPDVLRSDFGRLSEAMRNNLSAALRQKLE